ncbi:MAG TPA: RagB/SusD family nutrient uptake outer membrane protein [Gemmatimonadaceae bacterium]|nr:RagB/SusD family nutrient uptake outer membrane protein [Gemmatimonadaceae bacterium]
MKKRYAALAVGVLTLSNGCSDYLDVNTNPNAPQDVSANLYLPAMLHWMVTSPQFDGRHVGHYTQEWLSTSTAVSPRTTWGRMGFDPASDNGAQQWRDVYWSLGQNLVDMTNKAAAEERWDLLGVALLLKAWGWQVLTDLHGEIVIQEAIDPLKTAFTYDTQEFAYQEVQRLLDSAIVLLGRSDGAVDVAYLAKGDRIYNGDRAKWLRLAHGMLALNLNHYSNKASYDPARVISEVNASFVSVADEPLLTYPGTSPDNADRNFWGRTRDNLTLYRQTQFVVNLMNGNQFGGVVDPRMTRMLSPAPDLAYRGLDPNTTGFGTLAAAQQPNNFFGYVGTGGVAQPARYLFSDKSKIPLMTYAQLQFVKAEAALKMGDQATALAAYTNGISSHIDWVNARNLDDNQAVAQITAAEKAAFLASPAIVPPVLTLSHIMSQKYIAQWAWGHNEIWMDMRRYHYTDIDPVSGTQVFRGFTPPTVLYNLNAGKIVWRIRPRYNSEYVWNRAALDVIGGLADDYHTVPMWITQP